MAINQDDFGIFAKTIDGGNLVFFVECCGNPCGDVPEMLVTVTGASGTINWCGETWVLPDDSGVEKSVCPDNYLKSKSKNTTEFGRYSFSANHLWQKNQGAGDSLAITRNYLAKPYGGGGSYFRTGNYNNNRMYVAAKYSRIRFTGLGPALPIIPSVTYTYKLGSINKIGAVDDPTYSNYDLTDDFFGSYTDGAGITYSWRKGEGWPT